MPDRGGCPRSGRGGAGEDGRDEDSGTTIADLTCHRHASESELHRPGIQPVYRVCSIGGMQGLRTWAAQPPLAKNGRNRGGMDDLSLEYCSCEAGVELYPH